MPMHAATAGHRAHERSPLERRGVRRTQTTREEKTRASCQPRARTLDLKVPRSDKYYTCADKYSTDRKQYWPR